MTRWMVVALVLVWGCAGLIGCHGDATCGDACSHYLSCAGASDAYQSQCVSGCESAPATNNADWLNNFVGTDCATAVAIVSSSSSGSSGTSGSSGLSSSGGSSGGCYPDGHACKAGGDCCNGNCIDQSVNDWICY